MTLRWRTMAVLTAGMAFSYILADGAGVQSSPPGSPASRQARSDALTTDEHNVSKSIGELVRENNSPLPSDDESMEKLQKAQELLRAITSIATRPAAMPRNEFPVLPPVKIESTTRPVIATRPSERTIQTASPKDLEMIKQLPPTVFYAPLSLADRLFSQGRLDLAAVFYEQAAKLVPLAGQNIKPLSKADKAWALYQLGNCLRDKNPEEAKKAYQKVVDEYPDSTWKDMSDKQIGMIDWNQTNKPEQELQQLGRQ